MARINNTVLARTAVSIGAAALVALGTALPSFADSAPTSTSTVTVTGGALSAGTLFSNFVPVKLNGAAQKPTSSLLLTNIIDSTGRGFGWHLTVTVPAFSGPDHAGTPVTHTLPFNSLTLSNSPVVTALDGTSSDPVNLLIGPGLVALTPLDLSALGTSVLLLTAPASEGMGSYNVTPINLTLNLPANTYAADYASTAIVSMITAP